MTMQSTVAEESIRHRAYLLWEGDGRPHDRDEHYWHLALAQLRDEAASVASSGTVLEAPPGKPKKETRDFAANVFLTSLTACW